MDIVYVSNRYYYLIARKPLKRGTRPLLIDMAVKVEARLEVTNAAILQSPQGRGQLRFLVVPNISSSQPPAAPTLPLHTPSLRARTSPQCSNRGLRDCSRRFPIAPSVQPQHRSVRRCDVGLSDTTAFMLTPLSAPRSRILTRRSSQSPRQRLPRPYYPQRSSFSAAISQVLLPRPFLYAYG